MLKGLCLSYPIEIPTTKYSDKYIPMIQPMLYICRNIRILLD